MASNDRAGPSPACGTIYNTNVTIIKQVGVK